MPRNTSPAPAFWSLHQPICFFHAVFIALPQRQVLLTPLEHGNTNICLLLSLSCSCILSHEYSFSLLGSWKLCRTSLIYPSSTYGCLVGINLSIESRVHKLTRVASHCSDETSAQNLFTAVPMAINRPHTLPRVPSR